MAGKVVWALSLGFLAGVFLRSFSHLAWPFALFSCFLAVCILFCISFARPKRGALIAAAVACAAFGLGILRMDSAALVGDPALSAELDRKVVLMGTVVAEPDVREKSARLRVRAQELFVSGATTTVDAGVLVVAPVHSGLAYGDIIRAEGTLLLPEPFDTDAGRTFNYPMFLAKDGILYTLAFAEVERVGEAWVNPAKAGAIWLKHTYLGGLGQVLSEPEAGLAGGITVGDKRSIGQELSDTFLKVSLIHIVVLSGYNMTVVINGAAHVFSFLPRYGKFALSGGIVALFILMTGGAASATRAGAMALLATYARLTGRTFLALRVLTVVALAMVLWNPYLLAFDPGFQLSILATCGLILFTPLISARLPFLTERFGMREIVASTIGTQMSVLPLLLWQNGNLSLVSIPANLFALIAVPSAMLFTLAAAISGIALGPWGVPLALPALILLKYIIFVANFFANVPFASLTVPAFGIWWMVAAYALLLAGYAYIQKKNGGQ